MTANYKTFGGNPHESAEQEPEPEQQSEQSESEQQPESEPESEQPEQPLNTKTDTQPRVRFFCVHTYKLGFSVQSPSWLPLWGSCQKSLIFD
jgi:hypothetical protein